MKQKIENDILILELSNEEISFENVNNILKDNTFLEYNIIIDVTNNEITEEEIDVLTYFSEMFRSETDLSFIAVIPEYSEEDFSEILSICPTLQEAYDIIEMENIERDLLKNE
ncbi:MAG: hypothetical protein Q3983_07980 [Capnocytophaga sp.]|nr:hypothetical protein [Capnocytophaga sp.]